MKNQNTTAVNKERSLCHYLSHMLAGGIFVISSVPNARSDESSLPVPINAGAGNASVINELTSPSLHPNIDVGHASATFSSDGHKLTVNQTTDKAVLDWNRFDIADGNSVQFEQPASSSVALNNIHQVDASHIFGNLTANGQVYLVNANGFVFGKNATVNTNSLVATNLKISDAVFSKGITNVVDSNAIASSGTNLEPVAALSGDGAVYRNTGNGNREKITILVEKGANISASNNGRVILAAPEVENNGTISAPDGQVILAAATDKVYLQASDSSDLRGLLVEVQTGGDVKNVGKILTERGNTTMMGFAVSQKGIVSASTSVALNGSVRLLAREGGKLEKSDNGVYQLKPVSTLRSTAQEDGLGTQATVTTESGSLTTVTLDNSGGTAVNEQAQPQSTIDIEAQRIQLKSGSHIIAHGGIVNLTTAQTPSLPMNTTTAANKSGILLESGSIIDVSGVKNVEMAMSSNVLNVELRNNELRDAPIQKAGILHGKTVQVDIRKGTPIADISGAVAKVQHSVAERNTAAGTVNLHSEGDIIVQPGATIDISGGFLHYLGGFINSTRLVSGGSIFDISQADPNRTYQQILTGRYFEPDYFQGKDAGTLDIKTRDLVLDGNIVSGTVNGFYQRHSQDWAESGLLRIDTAWTGLKRQDVMFQNNQTLTPVSLDQGIFSPLYLSNALFANGLSGLSVNTFGKLTITKNTALKLPTKGYLSLQAGEIDMLGSVTTTGGDVTLKTQQQLGLGLNGTIYLSADSYIDTAGNWINDVYDSRYWQALKPLSIDGGDISLLAQGNLLLDGGSQLIANGGAWLNHSAKISAGAGGNITLAATTSGSQTSPSTFKLEADVSSYALENGGELSITANSINISDPEIHTADQSALNISSAQLETGGFSRYNLTANDGALNISDNTHINLLQSNWLLNNDSALAASGTDLSTLVHRTVLPDFQRHAVDLTLTHSAANAYSINQGIHVGSNSMISADPKSALTLNSDANIVIDGTLKAPSGTISLNLTAPKLALDSGFDPNLGIILGANSQLSVAGTLLLMPNNFGLRQGEVKDGGEINITAKRGYILTDSNSTLDVSGSNSILDMVNNRGLSRQNTASNAGSINLSAAEGMVLQGQFKALAGSGVAAAGMGSSTMGGSLTLELNAQQRGEIDGFSFPTGDRVIHVSNKPLMLMTKEQITADLIPVFLNGQAYISTNQINQGGFDFVNLSSAVPEPASYSENPTSPQQGEIRFDGDVSLAVKQFLSLDAPVISHTWGSPGDSGQILLQSNIVNLGSKWNRAAHGSTTTPLPNSNIGKNALFSISANLIDLNGSSQIRGFAQTQLNSSGDIRLTGVHPNDEADLVGSINLSGDLTLRAREIYPTTLSKFSMKVDSYLNPNGTITILPISSNWSTPLSAAGQLNLEASNIISQGTLLAPFGTINLTASNSLKLDTGSFTSVSDNDGIMIPFGRTQGGISWIYPLSHNIANIQDGTPAKTITLSSPDIDLAKDAVLNLNGGGDLSAFEFISGPDGSSDVLETNLAYAVLPSYLSGYAPYDELEFSASGLTLGENVFLSADSSLPAGNYVLLPAHYALLPGAFLVTPQAGFSDMAAGTKALRTDGASIVAGYRYTAGNNIADSRWSGFVVEPGNIARTRSEYQETTASQFFKADGSLPQDAGNLSLLATQRMELAAQISATATSGGLGGMLDISANQLSVVKERSVNAEKTGIVELIDDELNHLGVDSILLGGRRTRSHVSTQLNVSAKNIDIASDTHLRAPEVLLAATDSVVLDSGASITARGNLSKSDRIIDMTHTGTGNTDGALLRVSNASQAILNRADSALTRQTGTLSIAENTLLSGSGSILLDASKDNIFNGHIAMDKGELTLSSSLITLGGTHTGHGLNLSESALNDLHVDSLTLNSYSTVDLVDTLNLKLHDLIIDSAGVTGYGGSGDIASIDAANITLQNTHNAVFGQNSFDPALLYLQADTITLGSGDYNLNGFSQVKFNAQSSLLDTGRSNLTVDSDVRINAPIWTATSGADTTLNLGSHHLATIADGSAPVTTALGARLNVTAESIDHQGRIALGSGTVKLDSTHDLTIAGIIDTSGRTVDLAGNELYSGGGTLSLTSEQGNLNIQPGANLDISGSRLGGDAGSLVLSASKGRSALNGNIDGHGYQNANGGSFSLDTMATDYTRFSELNGLIQLGGFTAALSIRQRAGNISIAASDNLKAKNIVLTADSGRLDVLGSLDVSGAQAGLIQLSAGDQLDLLSTAKLSALSTANGNKGGKVLLTSIDADADKQQGVTIANGANVNVSAVDSELGGTVDIMVNRIGTNDAAVSVIDGTVNGAANMTVTAMEHYRDIPLSNAQIQQWRNDTQAYLDSASLNTNLHTRLGGFGLQPGLDIQSTSSVTLDLAESLAGNNWVLKSGSNTIWTTPLNDIAGLVNSLQQIGNNGVVRSLTDAGISTLTKDGTYYFDANPESPTFRTLFVQIFPGSGSTTAIKYNPSILSGSLIEHNGWDLELQNTEGQNWHFGDTQSQGLLSLRSANDLTINQTLNDGFAVYDTNQLKKLFGFDSGWLSTLVLQTGKSWNYNLVAGADLLSANPIEVTDSINGGSLTLGKNTSVRTGTGDIHIAAAGDIKLTDWTSTIYTAGRAAENERWGSLGNYLTNITNQFVATSFFVEYPFDGGDITFNAKGNIIGASTSQFMADWLQRTGQGGTSNGALNRATAWGIAFDSLVKNSNGSPNLKFGFRENIGALGGGNIDIHADANINDLSVMMPSSAKPVGPVNPRHLITENSLQQQGGGNLTVMAGQDIDGGVFFVDKGSAEISAKGAIRGGAQFTSGPVFAIGDAQFNVHAGNGIEIGAVLNPFVLTEPKFLDKTSYFASYTENSGINLQSLAGDVRFNNDVALIKNQAKRFNAGSAVGETYLTDAMTLMSIYPGNLSAYALTGGLQIENSMALYPASNSKLDLQAYSDILIGDNNSFNAVTINQLDVDPTQLLSVMSPSTIDLAGSYLGTYAGTDTTRVHAALPIHQNETSLNKIVSAQGSIIGNGKTLIAAAKATEVSAGLDMINLGLQIQNLHSDDVTRISAGRDIKYTLQRDPISGAVSGATSKIELAGPGLLNISAGRTIDLGISEGITTIGAQRNPSLPGTGADILVLAGNQLAKNSHPLDDFLDYYVRDGAYQNKIPSLNNIITFSGRFQLALEVLFEEIRNSTKLAATSHGVFQQAAYQRGYDAIARLLPNNPEGDIKLSFSRIQTLEGGSINLLAPGGMVNVGLASAFTGGKNAEELGIIAEREGDINILVKGDLMVNQQRVFTLDSGDITVWSSEGNIDAGRGSKSALSTQSPKITIDKITGKLTVEFPPTVSGSGIRAQSGYHSDHIGNVTLAAPRGVIDAGEAGIGGRDITLAASAVIGASNIQALGNLLGGSQAAISIPVPTTLSNAAAAATKSGSDQVFEKNDGTSTEKTDKVIKMALIDTQLIGFGNCSVADIKNDKQECRNK